METKVSNRDHQNMMRYSAAACYPRSILEYSRDSCAVDVFGECWLAQEHAGKVQVCGLGAKRTAVEGLGIQTIVHRYLREACVVSSWPPTSRQESTRANSLKFRERNSSARVIMTVVQKEGDRTQWWFLADRWPNCAPSLCWDLDRLLLFF